MNPLRMTLRSVVLEQNKPRFAVVRPHNRKPLVKRGGPTGVHTGSEDFTFGVPRWRKIRGHVQRKRLITRLHRYWA